MSIRRYITQFIWLVLSLILFTVAAYMTYRITTVEGRSPLAGQSQTWGGPRQVLSLYAANADVNFAKQVRVSYYTARSHQEARLTIGYPGNVELKFFVNRLRSLKSCSSVRSSDDVAENDAMGGGLNVTVSVARDWKDDPLYLVVPKQGNGPARIHVECKLKSVIEPYTFTTRQADFWFEDFKSAIIFNPAQQVGGLALLPAYILYVGGIENAYDFQFLGGFHQEEVSNAERSRTLAAGQFVTVFWRDAVQEQFRDILLVVIGTLIGIGVTMLIEALRPFVARLSG